MKSTYGKQKYLTIYALIVLEIVNTKGDVLVQKQAARYKSSEESESKQPPVFRKPRKLIIMSIFPGL